MKRNLSIVFAAPMLAGFLSASFALAATDPSTAAIKGLSSTKENGVVSLVSEPTLADGRLILKVVAFNRATAPASFSDQNIRISTAAGKPVELVPLEQLVEEAERDARDASRRAAATGYNPTDYSYRGVPTTGTGGAGEPDVSGYIGASKPSSGVMSPHTQPSSAAASGDQGLQTRIDSLNAAILQPLTIAPSTAAGGQIVTGKLKFPRREERALRVVVDFNGEQHEFNFEAPPKR